MWLLYCTKTTIIIAFGNCMALAPVAFPLDRIWRHLALQLGLGFFSGELGLGYIQFPLCICAKVSLLLFTEGLLFN